MRRSNLYKSILLLCAFVCSIVVNAQTEQHLLWRLRAPNTGVTSYIFGSCSFPNKRVFELNDSVIPCLKASKVFAPQLAINKDNASEISKAMRLPEGQSLDSMFLPEELTLIKQKFTEITGEKITNEYLRLKPFALMSSALFTQLRGDSKVLLSDHLQNVAEKNGKDVISLEKVSEQLRYLELMPKASVLAYFETPGYYKDQQNKLLQLYLHRSLDALTQASFLTDDWTRLRQMLLQERNNALKTRLEQLFAQLPTFSVVDAVHLSGSNGILELLRNDGYEVTPVKSIISKKIVFVPEIKWKQFNENEKVSFFLPGTPVFEEHKVDSDLGLLTTGSYRYLAQKGDPNIFYGVSYTDYPAHIVHSDFKDMWDDVFNNSGDALITTLKGEMVEESNITLRGFPGRETIATFDSGTKVVHFQSFLVENRLFILQVITPSERKANSFVGKFLDSFAIKVKK